MKAIYNVKVEGDQDFQPVKSQGEIAGTLGESRKIEALKMSLTEIPEGEELGIAYCGHFEEVGWTAAVPNGASLDSQGRRLEALKVWLFGKDSDKYEITYRTHVQDLGWLNWARDGETTGTEGRGLRLEALQAIVSKKGEVFFDVNALEKSLGPIPVTVAPIRDGQTENEMRRRIVDIAHSYIGYVAKSGNWSVFGDRYNDPYGEWCNYFVRAVFEDAGLGNLVAPTGYVPYTLDWFINHEDAYFHSKGTYTPLPGDIVLFDYNANGTPDHIGIVDGCDGERISTIEGNTSEPRQVKWKVSGYLVNDPDVFGYCEPAYWTM